MYLQLMCDVLGKVGLLNVLKIHVHEKAITLSNKIRISWLPPLIEPRFCAKGQSRV